MPDFPYENTLTTNSTHQQLVSLGGQFARGVILSPSRIEEKNKGYDIKHMGAKQLEYQYKRPINRVKNRELQSGSRMDCFAFPFEGEQAETLWVRNQIQNIAFYVLPLVESDGHLSNILKHTVFVDVAGVFSTVINSPPDWADFSRFYITENTGRVFLKHAATEWRKSSAYYEIPSQFVYSWTAFSERVQSCHVGLQLRTHGGQKLTQIAQAKKELDIALNGYRHPTMEHNLDSENKVYTIDEIVGIARKFRAIAADHEYRSNERLYPKETEEKIDEKVRALLGRTRDPEDLIPNEAIDLVLEFGDEAPALSLAQ